MKPWAGIAEMVDAADKVYRYRYTVQADEIDDLNHAGNFHYVKWMQHAAIAHSTAIGWSPEAYDGIGAGWVVRSHQVTYLMPAFVGDDLTIETWVADMKSATSLRRYRILDSQGRLLASAETNWAFINYERQKPVRIPGEVRSSFEPIITDYSTS